MFFTGLNISIQKQFGELSEKKISRIKSKLIDVIGVQSMKLFTAFDFEKYTIILDSNAQLVVYIPKFNTLDELDLTSASSDIGKIIDLLELDMKGKVQFTFDFLEKVPFSIQEMSKTIFGDFMFEKDAIGAGIRVIKSSDDGMSEVRIEPSVEFNDSLFLFSQFSVNKDVLITDKFIKDTTNGMLDSLNKYRDKFLEKGGKSA